MRVRIQKWGNSLALRIPKPFAEEAEVREGAILDLSVQDGRLIAKPVAQRKYALKQLLRGIRKDNIHEEIDWGGAVGREAW